MHVETKYFLIFENILRTRNNFRILQVLLSTIFYKSSGTFNETFLTLSLLAHIFSKKNPAGFCFLINLKFKKMLTALLAFLHCQKMKIQKHPGSLLELARPLSNVVLL